MPEGDTLFRAAARLRPVMEGRAIDAARHRDSHADFEDLVGHEVTSVEARGKHLLIVLNDARVIHSHLGMTGSWHIYRPGESWRKPTRQAALNLRMSAHPESAGDPRVVVCFNPKLLELLTATGVRRHAWLSRLGPDLLARDFDVEEAIARIRVHDAAPIGVAIMNQSIVCGIGNVYKSESLFLTQAHPLHAVAEFPDNRLVEILQTARQLMRRNLSGYPRRTRDALGGKRLWVYKRRGEPCYKCRTPIVMQRQGDQGRSTYWCPTCQPA